MGGSVGNALNSTVGRAGAAAMTMGASEMLQKNPYGVISNPAGIFGGKNLGISGGGGAYAGQDPSTVLAQTGGAPLLANIAMGANIDDTLSGYLGIPKAEFLDAIDGRNTYLDAQTVQNIKATRAQLDSIQQNRDLRQQAVDKVVNDFPNIVQSNMKMYGDQFDSTMKDYVNQALQGTAAKYAANGGISSGAADAAFARTAGEQALNKLNYSNTNAVRDASARLGEVNALRDFQNTMLGQTSQQGFSATQANLQRQFQGQQQQNDFANQSRLADQSSKNAMFGALGSLGGTAIGAMAFGPIGGAAGGQMGSSLFGASGNSGFMSNPRLNLNNNDTPSLMRRY